MFGSTVLETEISVFDTSLKKDQRMACKRDSKLLESFKIFLRPFFIQFEIQNSQYRFVFLFNLHPLWIFRSLFDHLGITIQSHKFFLYN